MVKFKEIEDTWTCPKCKTKNTEWECVKCGYDSGEDFEQEVQGILSDEQKE